MFRTSSTFSGDIPKYKNIDELLRENPPPPFPYNDLYETHLFEKIVQFVEHLKTHKQHEINRSGEPFEIYNYFHKKDIDTFTIDPKIPGTNKKTPTANTDKLNEKQLSLIYGFMTIHFKHDEILSNLSNEIMDYFADRSRIKSRRIDEDMTVHQAWKLPAFRKKLIEIIDNGDFSYENVRKKIYKFYMGASIFKIHIAFSVYELFGAEKVLDMCAGWGVHLLGALFHPNVSRYNSFDPNYNLIAGHRIERDMYMNYYERLGL